MFKVLNEYAAIALANKHKLLYGLCAFDGCYYVGNEQELKSIGCISIRV